MNILFVCTGNTCRSPMAKALLEDMAQEKGIDINVKSAGIYALDGQS
ncbi:MAG: low molecular weight protein arginine phosphatase, partial [Tissierellia bacterium]|nr:low molecular weight protein arginine phosphatase [Tissierellia bacterium]